MDMWSEHVCLKTDKTQDIEKLRLGIRGYKPLLKAAQMENKTVF